MTPPGAHTSGGADVLRVDERSAHLTPNSYVSIALMAALLAASVTGATIYGRQSQRLESMEKTLHETRSQLNDVTVQLQALKLLIIERTPQPQSTGR